MSDDRFVDPQQSLILTSPSKFKLGILSHNCLRGCSITSAAGTAEVTWDESCRIALAAERAGFEAVIPVARWKGFPGPSNFNGRSFETFTWAAGLAAITSTVTIFATFHMPTAHPVRIAKMLATVDHIAGGRFGINFVAGWEEREIHMFGQERLPHDERYQFADEVVTLLRQLAIEEDEFDFRGEYFDLRGLISDPRPLQQPFPVTMAAGVSPRGRMFAAKHADISFIAYDTVETAARLAADIKRVAQEDFNRQIKVFGQAQIVCAETEKEARSYFDYYVHERGDREAAEYIFNALTTQAGGTVAYTDFDRETFITNLIAGWGAVPLVGTPEQVVEGIVRAADAGLDGMTLAWVNYEEGIEQYRRDILPLLIQAGLRADVTSAGTAVEGKSGDRFGLNSRGSFDVSSAD